MYTESIRIGTMVNAGPGAADYIRQILPYGFESFSISFWQTLGDTNLKRLAEQIREALADSGAVISSVSCFGNPLGTEPMDDLTRQGWRKHSRFPLLPSFPQGRTSYPQACCTVVGRAGPRRKVFSRTG